MKAGHPNSVNESTAEQDPGEAASLLRAVFKQGLESLLSKKLQNRSLTR